MYTIYISTAKSSNLSSFTVRGSPQIAGLEPPVVVLWFRLDSGGREIRVTIVRGLLSTGTAADLYISSSRISSTLCAVVDL